MRKKIFKIVGILLINILFILVLIFILDVIIFKYNYKEYCIRREIPKFHYILKKPIGHFIDRFSIDYRDPIISKYDKGKNPIVVFGCSFAYGQYLEPWQIFSYKLSKLTGRSVFNRSYPGWGLQHMYFQAKEKDKTDFYKQIPYSDTVIYILMHDHYYRMLIKGSYDRLDDSFYIHYKYKDKRLVADNYKNIFLNLLKSSYTFKYINENIAEYYSYPEPWLFPYHTIEDKVTDYALKYFIETRKELERNWFWGGVNSNNKLKFIILMYNYGDYTDKNDRQNIAFNDLMKEKLKQNGFIVIDTTEITKEYLNSPKYLQENDHPTEAAWDLITPAFVKKTDLRINGR